MNQRFHQRDRLGIAALERLDRRALVRVARRTFFAQSNVKDVHDNDAAGDSGDDLGDRADAPVGDPMISLQRANQGLPDYGVAPEVPKLAAQPVSDREIGESLEVSRNPEIIAAVQRSQDEVNPRSDLLGRCGLGTTL